MRNPPISKILITEKTITNIPQIRVWDGVLYITTDTAIIIIPHVIIAIDKTPGITLSGGPIIGLIVEKNEKCHM